MSLEFELMKLDPAEQYPDRILNLLSTKGFDDAFFQALGYFRTQQEAYECIEELCEKWFKRRMYSDFTSYRVSRNKRYREKK